MNEKIVLDCFLHKLPSTRKTYRVRLFVPENEIPIIEYHQTNAPKKPKKSIQFVDLLFADKKHGTNDNFAFSIYSISKTITFLARDEPTMNEWLSKIRELHAKLYPEFKRYDAIFEANLLDRGLAKTMQIQGTYRLALCKDSLDLIPLITARHLLSQEQNYVAAATNTTTTAATTTASTTSSTGSRTHNRLPQNSNDLSDPLDSLHHSNHTPSYRPHHLPNHQRFHKRHPLLRSNTIELLLRSIRRCGHTGSNFYIESGRHSQIGEGDLWMSLNKKATVRHLHELLLAAMKLASTVEDQFLYKAPRSRSGSSSETAHRSQQSRSSSLICLASENQNSEATTSQNLIINNNNINNNQSVTNQLQAAVAAFATNHISTIPMLSSGNNVNGKNSKNDIDEDTGYLPMA